MSILLDRIETYRNGKFNDLKNKYADLANSQNPHTLIVTCADSRVCPQEFGLSDAGELFVVRNAGNLIPPYNAEAPSNEGLTIEYGVVALGVKELVVCGHASCGAMGGLQDTSKLGALPLVKTALESYRESFKTEVEACETLPELIHWNVENQLKTLFEYPFIKEKLESGELKVYGAVYDFVNATVTSKCELHKTGEVT